MQPSFRALVAVAIALASLLGFPPAATASGPATDAAVPDVLAPWVDWVLHDADERACALGRRGAGARLCAWPGRLALQVDGRAGRFEQTWTLQAAAWVPLPGGGATWPQQVQAGDEPLVVVERDGRPAVQLGAGEHLLRGAFEWPRRPEVLPVPPETGLVSLHLDGEPVADPRLDRQGRLWLGQRRRPAAAVAQPDRVTLEVTRRIDDAIPLRVLTRLALDVSGQARELTLGPVLLPGGIPLRIESPLPARLREAPGGAGEGRWMLQLQLRPGRWVLTVHSHHPGPVETLRLGEASAPWPAREVWAFAAQPDLRQVEVRGAERIDPRQTQLPADWQRLPVYLLRAGQTLELQQLRRGALSADRLRLERELRLDFSGTAFSVRDRLSGQLEERWRLEAEPVLELGQVQVGGEPRFITRLEGDHGSGRAGIEVRQGQLDLRADARLVTGPAGFGVALPAAGWALPLEGIETQLHLPPGWDLLAVAGVDNLPASWLARWSLLDIFLVLVIALGVARLWGWPWGLLALLTLALVWPEPGAPRWIWLHVLVAAALLRLLPRAPSRGAFERLRALLQLYYRGALLVLAVIALPFLVTEMRDGLFPQLDRAGAGGVGAIGSGLTRAPTQPQQAARAMAEMALDKTRPGAPESLQGAALGGPDATAKRLPTLAPDAVVQTGAGVPDWTWRRFTLRWGGPVTPDQQLRLWLLPPAAALALAGLRVVLVLLLGLRMAGWPRPARPSNPTSPAGVAGVLLAGGLLAVFGGDTLAATASSGQGSAAQATQRATAIEPVITDARADRPAAESVRGPLAETREGQPPATATGPFPPAQLLRELKERLLKPPECLPRCAEIPRMGVVVSGDALRLLLEVDAAAAVALPLPGSADGWQATEMRWNGASLPGLRRDTDGALLTPLPAGRHRLMLSGPLPDTEQVDIPLPLRPRQVTARIAAPWQLEGVDADGRPGDQLRLVRGRPAAASDGEEEKNQARALPALLRVTRELRLGLDWTLETRVERLSPAEAAISLRLPLVPGEAVTTPGRQVANGRLLVSLPPGRQRMRWSSTLEPVDRLTLTAATDPRLTEVWRLQVSPIWHLEASGVPAVQNLGAAERWLPTWRPWPGERLVLEFARPAGVAGPTLTLDRSVYRVTPGRRATDASLELGLRSSQGGRHAIRLPAGAELLRFTVDGEARPLALQGRTLELPLVPGRQEVSVAWRVPTPLRDVYRPASLELGTPGVNARTQVELGRDRWLLWTAGPGIGPAVLFWGLLIVLALAAAVLARSPLTPLGFTSWLLLGVGLSQAGAWAGALVILWLFALGLRRRLGEDGPPWQFNLAQVGLALLSVVALAALIGAVQQGLLGDPAMQVAGNGSSASSLNWYLDRHAPQTAPVTVVSAPIWVYRALMLAWALWLAWRLLDWLRWGWRGFTEPTLWRQPLRKPKTGQENAAPG